jgi:hypothetical protein
LKGGENESCGKKTEIWLGDGVVARRPRNVAGVSPGKVRRNRERRKKLPADGFGGGISHRPAYGSNREDPTR